MLVYRLGSKEYIRDLTGTGARIYGGRWNPKGTAMLYASEHRSLAVLEIIVHTPTKLLPDALRLLSLHVPDELAIEAISRSQLPHNWDTYPAPDALAEIGHQWVMRQSSPVLKVPAVPVPDEHNILLNPNHPDFDAIRIADISTFQLDARF